MTLEHAFVVSLFRENSTLPRDLLTPHLSPSLSANLQRTTAEIVSEDLTQVVPTEYRADSVIVHRDPAGAAQLAVVVEVQRTIDEVKRWTWPVYLGATRARHRCPTILLVVSPRKKVAAWAREPILLDPIGSRLQPIAFAYADIPEVLDEDLARRSPALAVLSAIAHKGDLVARIALAAIVDVPQVQRGLYSDAILRGLVSSQHATAKGEVVKKNCDYKTLLFADLVSNGRKLVLVDIARSALKQISEDEELALMTLEKEGDIKAVTKALLAARSAVRTRKVLTKLVELRGKQIAAAKRRWNPLRSYEMGARNNDAMLEALLQG